MDKLLKDVLALREQGFAVQWLRPGQKAPIRADWSKEQPRTAAELMADYRPGNNVGFRPGSWSVVEGFEICVLDIDIRGGERFKAEAWAAAEAMAGEEFTVLSGSGIGRHYYIRFPIGTSPDSAVTVLRQSDVWVNKFTQEIVAETHQNARPAWVIELLSTGKNVVMPPSIHPETALPYIWTQP